MGRLSQKSAARLPRSKGRAIAFSLFALSFATAVHAQGSSPHIALAVSPTLIRAEGDGREIVLIFPGAISPADRAALESAAASGVIEGLNMGEDAARLRLLQPAEPRIERGEAAAILILAPTGPAAASWAQRRVSLAGAGVALQEGNIALAREIVGGMLLEAPQDTALIERMAAIEAAAGRIGEAISIYDRALGVDPDASSLLRARRSLAAQQEPSLRGEGFAAAAPGGERVVSGVIAGGTAIHQGWRAQFRAETRYGSANSLRQTGTDFPAPFSDTKLRGEFALERQWEDGGVTRLALLGANRSVGLGLLHTQRIAGTQLTADLAWNQSYWDTIMAFAADAVRNRAVFDATFRPTRGLLVQIGSGYVGYGLPDGKSVAEGGALLASISWTAPEHWSLADGWQFRMGYRLGAEYLSSVARGTTPNGTRLPLLDVRSREVHSIEAAIEGPFGPGQVTILGGYAIDRYGGPGPLGLIRLTNRDPGPVTFGVEVGVGPSLADNPRAVWRIGGFLRWRFST